MQNKPRKGEITEFLKKCYSGAGCWGGRGRCTEDRWRWGCALQQKAEESDRGDYRLQQYNSEDTFTLHPTEFTVFALVSDRRKT